LVSNDERWEGRVGERRFVGDAAFGSRVYGANVFVQRARRRLERRRPPGGLARGPLGVVDDDVDGARRVARVDADRVAVLQQRNRPADLRLGRDVADAEAVRPAAEPAVGEQSDDVAEA
jgi:hypothetical protein